MRQDSNQWAISRLYLIVLCCGLTEKGSLYQHAAGVETRQVFRNCWSKYAQVMASVLVIAQDRRSNRNSPVPQSDQLFESLLNFI